MPSLQIRDCPEPLHQLLQLRARHHHRSLSQQALAEQQPTHLFEPSPEELIRQDRAR